MARAIRSINVRELLEALEGEDPEALVVFCADYGDIGHTQQVLPINGEIEEVQVEESAYSASGWAVRREEDDDDEESAVKTVPILLIK